MTRPSIDWIHMCNSGNGWTVVTQRNGHHRHFHNFVTHASRFRLEDLVGDLCRAPYPPQPRLVVRPCSDGYCAYPDPERSSA